MQKDKVLSLLNHFREQLKLIEPSADDQVGTSFEVLPSLDEQALEVAIQAVTALPPEFRLSSGARLFK